MDERDISKDSSTDFPVELWMHIGSCVGLRDLSSLARTCTLFNQIMTPILYSSVHLYRESQAKAFLDAITPSGKEDSEGVDPGVQPPHDQTRLQAVRDLRIHITETTDPEDLCEKAALAVARMNSLKTIWCGQPFQYVAGEKLLSALFMHPHPMLHTMSIPLYSGLEVGERAPPLPLKNSISTSLPSLLHISVYFYLPLSLSHVEIIRNLLNSLGNQLETISIPDLSPLQTKELFSEAASFGALRHIGVNWFAVRDGLIPTVYYIRSLSLGLKHLRVIGHEAAGHLPEAYFPALEELACDCKTLPAFLPLGMAHARPIRCVRLNNAYWTHDVHVGAHASMTSTFLDLALFPFMSHLVSALSYLGNSAVPVRELSFCVRQLLEEGLKDAREAWATLEKLVIIPRVAPDTVNGCTRPAHPCLLTQ